MLRFNTFDITDLHVIQHVVGHADNLEMLALKLHTLFLNVKLGQNRDTQTLIALFEEKGVNDYGAKLDYTNSRHM